MIFVRFGGGLGNQMFQYAFLYQQCRGKNIEICGVMHRNRVEDKREFALSSMNLSIPIVLKKEHTAGIWYISHLAVRKILDVLKRKQNISPKQYDKIMKRNDIVYARDIYKFKSELVIPDRKAYVEGAFQTWKYFDCSANDLRKEFCVNIDPSIQNEKILSKIRSCNSVCVHIRRGDYINRSYANELEVCGYSYYNKAIEYMKERVCNPIFFIFSNTHKDIEWIKENYQFQCNIYYVDLSNPDYEELRLMYHCKHFIISNSTFSWWAQFLSQFDKKIVIAPKKWNLDKSIDYTDIYMPNWKCIDV